MKTNPKKHGGSGGGTGRKFGTGQNRNNHRGKPKNDRFFQKNQNRNNDARGGGGKPFTKGHPGAGGPKQNSSPVAQRDHQKFGGDRKPFNKNRPGFKNGGQNQQHRGNEKRFNRNHPGGGNKPGPGGYKWGNKSHGSGQNHPNKHPQQLTQNLDELFTEKPVKLDYCLAPERLEAQARAIKRFEQQERQGEQQQRQKEKDRRHKLMTAKTKKGQPVMHGRMEMLYEKVQKMVGQG